MSGAADVAPQQMAVHNGSSSHARAKSEQDHIPTISGRTTPYFPQQGGVSVVENRDRGWVTKTFLPVETFKAG